MIYKNLFFIFIMKIIISLLNKEFNKFLFMKQY